MSFIFRPDIFLVIHKIALKMSFRCSEIRYLQKSVIIWQQQSEILQKLGYTYNDQFQWYLLLFSASDDINIRQTRWPKGEVDKNRVKKSVQSKLTFFVINDHIIGICGMVYDITRRNWLEIKIMPMKLCAQYFISNQALILRRPRYHC